ncbi:glycosyltransferase family 39 protein [Pseudonocardia endophytica]|uniref:4-amino-4-deoxy-L-arabinose transferase-like glycosyltransferase n=1 Tax=Pseudonocardia endophytica TaxID=401976 RepID=A0A4V2PH95_PSEEN|nr:glycosyltransferase family 39 protein [Pseudonocardia endophytica]TCK19896.1 4-amino-4-deoxy-L-arabinose transferase-like glycosyltransferase [Pseudonocardia endophytica]
MTDTATVEAPPVPDPTPPRWPRRAALGLLTLIAGGLYGWGIGETPLEPYYAAAVRTMAGSWRAFAFGAFDPAQTITLDKLPGAFWLQALSVRAFGFHPWALVLPQVLAGMATVPLLYRAVRRLAGPGAGLTAALVLAVTPAVVALDRGNISDTVMVLLLVAAADAMSGAIVRGGCGRVLLAGVWVGLAFQAKMVEAWIVLPALALPYLVAGPGRAGRRTLDVVLGGLVTAAVSLAWTTAVALVPGSSRPWVDGSTGNSPFEQVFVYNGLGRVGQQSPLQVLAGQGLSVGVASDPGPLRLVFGVLGITTGWILPLAVLIAVAGVVARRREPRTDPVRAAVLLWGTWLVLFAVAFSVLSTVNPYYTAALGPPAAALVGIGLVQAWAHRHSVRLRIAVAVLVLLTAAHAALLSLAPGAPRGLSAAVLVVGVVAVVLVAVARRTAGRTAAAGFALAVVAVLLAPAVASATVVARDEGALDVPFEPARATTAIRGLFVRTPEQVAGTLPVLEQVRAGAPDLMAVQSSAVASVFAEQADEEVLPIGGFTGTGPTPSLDELRADVAAGRFHLVLAFPSHDPRIVWVATHCRHLGRTPPPFRDYVCTPADAAR